MKKLTPQWRITLLTALVLAVCSTALTALSMYNAKDSFKDVIEPFPISEAVEEMPKHGIPADSMETAASISPAQQAQRRFDTNSILFCVLFTVLGTAAVYVAVGRALRPLRKLSDMVQIIDERTLSERPLNRK